MSSVRFIRLIFISLIFTYPSLAQNAYESSVIVLNPGKVNVDPSLEDEIDTLDTAIKERFGEQLRHSSPLPEIENENEKLMIESQIRLAKNIDFYKNITLIITNYLQYRFSEIYPHYLIVSGNTKSSESKNNLSNIANQHNVRYVISFPKVDLIQTKNGKRSTFRVILFDNQSGQILLNKSYTGGDSNPGFTFACNDGSISCTINNALSTILDEVIYIINSQSKFIFQKRILSSKRDSVLLSKYDRSKTQGFAQDVIKQHAPNLIIGNFYSEIVNPDSSKVVAFFIEESRAKNFGDLSKYYPKEINVKTEDYDPTILPNTYAQIVYGVKFKGQWYLEISNATIFPSGSIDSGKRWFLLQLKELDYFEKNSAQPSTGFWENGLFKKVIDWTKTEEYDQFPEMYETRIRENKPYIGMYEVVADILKKERGQEIEQFEKEFTSNVIQPIFDKLTSAKTHITDYKLLNNDHFPLIYSTKKNGFLIPLSVSKNSKEYNLHFFFYDRKTNELFKWTYFESQPTQSSVYGSVIVNTLSEIVDWNFSYSTLDNPDFWKNYVFKKEDGEYLYLKRIEI